MSKKIQSANIESPAAPDPAAAAIAEVVGALRALTKDDQARVLRCVAAFCGLDVDVGDVPAKSNLRPRPTHGLDGLMR